MKFATLFRPTELHIPDGFLSIPVSLIFWGITLVLLWIALRRTKGAFSERQIPLMGVMAAFIFAAQMINFPVAGGTSGHMLGGALAAIALGPWAGMLVMTAVISVQALLFQDGGLLVMGANIFNMGLLTTVLGFGIYRLAANRGQTTRLAAAGIGAWLSVMAGALVTSIQLWLSGTTTANLVFPAMLGVHALIGVGEALITVAAVSFVLKTRPDILEGERQPADKRWVIAGVLIALGVLALAPFASADPDGLVRVATDLGFIDKGVAPGFNVLPEYTIPLLGESGFSNIAAGAVGMIVLISLFMFFNKRRQTKAGP